VPSPDETLFAAARADERLDELVLLEQARRILQDPRSVEQVVDFHQQWLGLGRLHASVESGDISGYADLRDHIAAQSARLVEHVVLGGGDLEELLTASYTFVNDPLAEFYGLAAPGTDDELARAQIAIAQARLTQPRQRWPARASAFLGRIVYARVRMRRFALLTAFASFAGCSGQAPVGADETDTAVSNATMSRTTGDELEGSTNAATEGSTTPSDADTGGFEPFKGEFTGIYHNASFKGVRVFQLCDDPETSWYASGLNVAPPYGACSEVFMRVRGEVREHDGPYGGLAYEIAIEEVLEVRPCDRGDCVPHPRWGPTCNLDDAVCIAYECDPLVQDCPDGMKCHPYPLWPTEGIVGATCIPSEDAQPEGAECTSSEYLPTLSDDCEQGLVCWAPDEQSTKRCVRICRLANEVHCPQSCVPCDTGAGFGLCLPECEEAIEDCALGNLCEPSG
jgi:hypothetical protein